jgi:L-lactate dehydrogenase
MSEERGGTTKLAIVGAGSVGATLAYACLVRGAAQTVALYDLDSVKVDAEVLDLRHGLQFVPRADIVGSDDVAVCANSDVVIVTAGAKQKPGQTRLDLARTNVDICRALVPQLLEVAPDAVLQMVTNPVDVVTYAAIKFAGLPAGRVFGSGTVLDSSRLRDLIARHCGVAVQNVHAWIVGEHGDSEIPLWSSADIGAIPARIVEAIVNDENRVLPVSTLLDGYHGIDDVCLSVPCIVNRKGVDAVLDVPMSPDEEEGLRRSGDTVRAVARSLGL